jgi:beta-glucanase (GH16 family)
MFAAGPPAWAQTPESGSQLTPPEPIRGKGYKLVQNWDFGVNVRDVNELRQLFHTRYIYNYGKQDHLGGEWTRYRDNENHVFIDGNLALVARVKDEMKPGKIESGMLRSKWTGQYGYFEIRMKAPAARGTFPAFWLNPEDQKWPPEIDVVEIVNNEKDTTLTSYHFLHEGKGSKKPEAIFSLLDNHKAYRPGLDYAAGFHTFAVEWTNDVVRHYVDEVLVVERTFMWKHTDGTDGGPAHVLVNLSVGGKWPGPPVEPEAFPAKLEIDYIRVWQR